MSTVSDARVLAHAALDVCLEEAPPAVAWGLLAAGADAVLPRLEAEAAGRRLELDREVARVRALVAEATALRDRPPEALTGAQRQLLRRFALVVHAGLLPVLTRP